ncbi:MAG: undecaprenyl-phosphate galactose phosphotransferase WbaP [Spirochaetota bacterium]|nr:undecaprenyl-phosphate galactose phosphotransferase WbaP [Spirochaetota bacterium]
MIRHRAKIYTKSIIGKLILLAGDLSILILSFFIAYNLRGIVYDMGLLSIPNVPIVYFYQYWYLFLIHLFFLYIFKIYNIRFSIWNEAREILKAITIATVFVFFILALLKISEQVSRFIIIFISIISIICIPALKSFLKFVLYRLGLWQADALIISNQNEGVDPYCQNLRDNWYIGYRPAYVITPYLIGNTSLIEYLTNERLQSIIKEYNIVLPILYKIDKDDFYKVFIKLDIFFDEIKLLPDMHSLFVNNITIEDGGRNFLLNINNNLLRFHNRLIQYVFNKIFSIIIFILVFPLLIFIGIAILIDSRGPMLYKAKRIGYKGRDFYIYKFRTMYKDADRNLDELLNSNHDLKKEFEESFKIKDDPRITSIGRILRKTSLDELPQLLNVLKGEMNLVGPRPIVSKERNKYNDAFYELIKVKPGITGLWQISGRNNVDYNKRIQLDLFFIKNWSLWMDVTILVKTFFVVIRGEGAY